MNLNNEHNKYTIADVINMYENDLEDYSMFKKLQQRAGSACYNSPADGGRSFFFFFFFFKTKTCSCLVQWFEQSLSSTCSQERAEMYRQDGLCYDGGSNLYTELA